MPSEIDPSSPFCQRWSGGRHSWRHTSEGGFDPARYTVDPLDETTAKTYVVTNHYSGSYPAARLRYGLFEDDVLRGVCVLGIPTSRAVLSLPLPGLEPYVESLELSRLVLADEVPANAETWFIARCFTEAAAAGVRGIVSFADPVPRVVAGEVLFPGHVGTIYQASNAVLCGRGTPRTLLVLPTGKTLNARSIQKVRKLERGHVHVEAELVRFGATARRDGEDPAAWLAGAMAAAGVTRLRHGGNHRYVFRIGTKAQRRRTVIGLPSVPYPKAPDLVAA
jgi:hypothetical protein